VRYGQQRLVDVVRFVENMRRRLGQEREEKHP